VKFLKVWTNILGLYSYNIVRFYFQVDVDKCQDITQTYRVTAMPTFIFTKNGQQVDVLQGADSRSLEAKVVAHNVDVDPFGSSKGHSLSNGAVPFGNAREARLAAFGKIDSKKPAANPGTMPP